MHEPGGVAGQPHIGVGDVHRLAHPSQRRLRSHGLQDLRRHGLDHLRGNEPRGHGVDADVVATELARPGLREADHPRFRRGIVRLAEVSVQTDDRGGVEHDSSAIADHVRNDGAGAEEHALEVYVDDGVERGVVHRRHHRAVLPLHELRVADDACVVHQHVDPSVVGDHFLGGGVHDPGLRHVHVRNVPDHHPRALVLERGHRGAADSRRTSGDDDDFVPEVEVHRVGSLGGPPAPGAPRRSHSEEPGGAGNGPRTPTGRRAETRVPFRRAEGSRDSGRSSGWRRKEGWGWRRWGRSGTHRPRPTAGRSWSHRSR